MLILIFLLTINCVFAGYQFYNIVKLNRAILKEWKHGYYSGFDQGWDSGIAEFNHYINELQEDNVIYLDNNKFQEWLKKKEEQRKWAN